MEPEVRLEYMRPGQVDAAKARCPAIYVPFGSIEFHGRHNVLGLDALKAHAQLVLLAQRVGGVVHPPMYLGTGGGHGDYPYSYMYGPEQMVAITVRMLKLFERDGFRHVVLLGGHYPNYFDYLKPAVAAYQQDGGTMRVLALLEAQVERVHGDHAALYETSYMMHLCHGTVEMGELAGHDQDITPPGEKRDWMVPGSESHPCYGLVGFDPRKHASAELGRLMTDTLLEALARWVCGEELARKWS